MPESESLFFVRLFIFEKTNVHVPAMCGGERALNGDDSTSSDNQQVRQKVIDALLADYKEKNTISHIDPDLALFNVCLLYTSDAADE